MRAGIDELALRLGHCCTLRTYPERHHLLLHERDADEVFGDCLPALGLPTGEPASPQPDFALAARPPCRVLASRRHRSA